MPKPYLLKIKVHLEPLGGGPQKRVFFTGKLVKRILIASAPAIAEAFKPTRGAKPKLIHITPLFTEKNGKVRCLHTAKRLKSGTYSFYLGSIDYCNDTSTLSYEEAVAILAGAPSKITFMSQSYAVDITRIELLDVEAEAKKAIEKLEKDAKIRIVFSSPTMLRDPLKKAKYKELVPTIMNIFSTPTYIYHYLHGTLTRRNLMKTLLTLHRALGIPYTYLQTLRLIKVPYREKPVPALAGYLNLHLHIEQPREQLDKALTTLQKLLPYLLALGTGTSRATGYGHITIKTPQ